MNSTISSEMMLEIFYIKGTIKNKVRKEDNLLQMMMNMDTNQFKV